MLEPVRANWSLMDTDREAYTNSMVFQRNPAVNYVYVEAVFYRKINLINMVHYRQTWPSNSYKIGN